MKNLINPAKQSKQSGFIFRDLLLGLCTPVFGVAAIVFFSALLLFQIGDPVETLYSSAGSGPSTYTQQAVPNSITDLQLSADGRCIISTQQNGVLRIFDAYTGEVFHRYQQPSYKALCVAISPDGLTAAAGHIKGQLLVWKQIDGRWSQTELNLECEDIAKLHFSADGRTLAAGHNDGYVSFFHVDTLQRFAYPKIDDAGSKCLQLFPDGRTAIVGGFQGDVTLWDIEKNEKIDHFKTGTQLILDLTISPTQNLVAVSSVSGIVSVWDLATHKQLWQTRPNIYASFSLDFSLDEQTLAIGGTAGHLDLYDVSGGKRVHHIQAHSRSVCRLQFSNDGLSLVSGGWDGTIRTWDLEQFQEVMTIE